MVLTGGGGNADVLLGFRLITLYSSSCNFFFAGIQRSLVKHKMSYIAVQLVRGRFGPTGLFVP